MTVLTRYRCMNCGKRFEIEVLTKEERREAERRQEPVYQIGCPDCRRTNVREGWE